MVKPQYYYYQNHGGGSDAPGGGSSWSNYLVDAYAGTAVGLSHFKWFVGKTMDEGLDSFLTLLFGDRDNGDEGGGIGEEEEVANDWRSPSSSSSTSGNTSDGESKYANTFDEEQISGSIPTTSTSTSTNNHGLRVVGVGYGRTGTYSLAIALDMLGFPTLVSS